MFLEESLRIKIGYLDEAKIRGRNGAFFVKKTQGSEGIYEDQVAVETVVGNCREGDEVHAHSDVLMT